MEEKRMTEKESLELISQMIQRTKERTKLGDGNQLLLWGYLTAGLAAVVYAALLLTDNPQCNLLWFLLPVVGIPAMKWMKRKDRHEAHERTYVDRISAGIWNIVSYAVFAGMFLCLGFTMAGYGGNCWTTMLIYAFVVVGFGAAAQGIVIRERSLVAGGTFSIAAGGIVTCCALSGIPLLVSWVLPLYIASFALMMIVPGHAINRKARLSCHAN